MPVKQFSVGGDRNFGYLGWDEESKEAFIVDPAYSPEMIINFAKENGCVIKYIFNTHSHIDHTNGNETAKTLTGISPINYESIITLINKRMDDDIILPLGNKEIKLLYTPGHTNDSICILFEDNLFTGDTLFVGKVGGTSFGKDAMDEYKSLRDKILTLPDETKIFPGHDYGVEPTSTIENEKKTNPFLLQRDYAAFIDLKKNWLSYKRKHGIT